MKFMSVFGWIPVLVIYTNRLPPHVGGRLSIFFLPFIKIRPKYRDDVGIHEHELEHVKQFYRSMGCHYFWYRWNPEYRLVSEARAFAVQLYHTPGYYEQFLAMLKDRYDLPFSLEQIAEKFDVCIAAHARTVPPRRDG